MGTLTINNEGCAVPLTETLYQTEYEPSPSDCSGMSFPEAIIQISRASIILQYLPNNYLETDILDVYITDITGSSKMYVEYDSSTVSVGDTIDFSAGNISVHINEYVTSNETISFSFTINLDDYTNRSEEVTYEVTMSGCLYTTTTTTGGSTTTTTPVPATPYQTSSNDLYYSFNDTVAVTAGAGMSVGDIIFAYATTVESTGIGAPSGSGWTEAYSITSSPTHNSWKVWYKIAVLADLTATTTVVFDDTSVVYLSICSFKCKSSAPYISTITGSNYFSVEKNNTLSPTLGTGVEDSLLVVFRNQISANHVSQYTLSITAGWFPLEGHNLGNWWWVSNYYKEQQSDGTTETCDITASKNINMQALLVQILPYL